MKASGWSRFDEWPASLMTSSRAPGNLLGHVLARGDERRVLVADDDQGRHADVGNESMMLESAWAEHAAGGVGQPLGRAMTPDSLAHVAASAAQDLQTPCLEIGRPRLARAGSTRRGRSALR